MNRAAPSPVVHLERHTGDLDAACELYARVCGWRAELVRAGSGSYQARGVGGGVGGGAVECPTARSLWLPYARVHDVLAATERAREVGATVPLEPREGPAGWRSVVDSEAGGE